MSNQTTYGVVQLVVNNGHTVGHQILSTGLTKEKAVEYAQRYRSMESDKKTFRYKVYREDRGYNSVA